MLYRLSYVSVFERETGLEPATNGLEGRDSTTELLPHRRRLSEKNGAGGWIRTTVGNCQQIYSLPPLTTRPRLRLVFSTSMELAMGFEPATC